MKRPHLTAGQTKDAVIALHQMSMGERAPSTVETPILLECLYHLQPLRWQSPKLALAIRLVLLDRNAMKIDEQWQTRRSKWATKQEEAFEAYLRGIRLRGKTP